MDTGRHIVFVVHGRRADRADFAHLVDWVRRRGELADVRVTWEDGDASRMARDAAARGADVVVAVGGDGTVNEVVNGLDGFATPLGIIPLGTANDLARQFGIPPDPDHAMDVVLRTPPIRIDTASLNGRRFVNVSTGGISAEATAETPAGAKEALGPLAYTITGLRKFPSLSPYHARFEGEAVSYEGEFLVFAVGNGRSTGAGMPLTPNASFTDGLIDVCIVEAVPRSEVARLLLLARKGEHFGQPGVHYARTEWLRITTEVPVGVNVDGEYRELDRLEYRARPADLLVHAAALPGEE